MALVGWRSASYEVVPVDGRASGLMVVGDAVELDLSDTDGNRTHHRLDLATKTLRPAVEVQPSALLQLGELTFHTWNHHFVVDGEPRGGYWMDGNPHNRLAIADPERGQLVLAGSDPAVPVVVIRPYDPNAARKPARPAPPPIGRS